MAVSSSYSFNLDPQSLVREAMQRASVLGAGEEPTSAEITMGMQFLNTELKSWQAAGKIMRQVERATAITLTSGTATYNLAADTISVEWPMSVTLSSDADTDYVVTQMTYADYQAKPDKNTTGIPTSALVEYKATPTVTLWPVPDGTVSSLGYVRHRLVRDLESGTNPDVHSRYLKALVMALAVAFAEHFKQSPDKIQRLEARHSDAMNDLDEDRNESGDLQFVLG